MQIQRERLNLLRQSEVISPLVHQNMNRFLDYLKNQPIQSDEDRLNMMSLHMAMALMRAQNGESIAPADGDLVEEVEAHPAYPKALGIWNAHADILGALPEGEKYYILANFCNIIKE